MNPVQTIILAGGQSTRLHSGQPKALAEVGGRAIIDHLVEALQGQGFSHISIALGASQAAFAEHFDLPVQPTSPPPVFQTVSTHTGQVKLRLLQTGDDSKTGGRLGRLRSLVRETFLLCWCDALWDADIQEMLQAHRNSDALVTLLAVHPPGRFGHLVLDENRITGFIEKPVATGEWINGGVFIVEPALLDLIDDDNCSLERDLLPMLARLGQLAAFRHEGFWHCMDTPGDQASLDRAIRDGMLA